MCAYCRAPLAEIPEIDISKLARLDERDTPTTASGEGASIAGDAPGAFAPPEAFAPPDAFVPDAFAPPVVGPTHATAARGASTPGRAAQEDDDEALGVERSTRAIRIDNQWQREKLAKQAAAAVPPPKPRRRIGGVLAAVAAIVAVIAAVVVIVGYQRVPPPRHPGSSVPIRSVPTRSVSIRITADAPTEVKIDGQRAGKTPLTLQRPSSTRPIQITAPGVTRRIVPDRDQVVDLSSR